MAADAAGGVSGGRGDGGVGHGERGGEGGGGGLNGTGRAWGTKQCSDTNDPLHDMI